MVQIKRFIAFVLAAAAAIAPVVAAPISQAAPPVETHAVILSPFPRHVRKEPSTPSLHSQNKDNEDLRRTVLIRNANRKMDYSRYSAWLTLYRNALAKPSSSSSSSTAPNVKKKERENNPSD